MLTEANIKHMVDRFLGWRLPQPWNPDAGISYKRPNYAHAPADHDWPTGTNLFSGDQAEAMIRYMIEGISITSPPAGAERGAVEIHHIICERMNKRFVGDFTLPKLEDVEIALKSKSPSTVPAQDDEAELRKIIGSVLAWIAANGTPETSLDEAVDEIIAHPAIQALRRSRPSGEGEKQ